MKGFPEKWCAWIESFVSKGSVGVKVNDDIGKIFQTKKGLRQDSFQGHLSYQDMGDFAKGGGQSLNCRCMSRLGGDGDGNLCTERVAI